MTSIGEPTRAPTTDGEAAASPDETGIRSSEGMRVHASWQRS
jgi:hypothetical protein